MSDSRKKKFDWGQAPVVLISPSVQGKGVEFGDTSVSLAETYQRAVLAAGALPLVLPCLPETEMLDEAVRRCDGLLLTGGDDIHPELYTDALPPKVARTVVPAGWEREVRDLSLIDAVFRHRKPLLAICRGMQLVNVALGGTLIADIPRQVPRAMRHNRMDRKSEIVHEARLTPGTMLAKIVGKQSLGVNSTHHQAVDKLAEPLQVSARADDGVVEAMELRPENAALLPFLMTVQFHPERLAACYAEHQAIFNQFARACVFYRQSKL